MAGISAILQFFQKNILDVIAAFPAITGQLRTVDNLDKIEFLTEGTPDFCFATACGTGQNHVAAAALEVIVHQNSSSLSGPILAMNIFTDVIIDETRCPSKLFLVKRCFFVSRLKIQIFEICIFLGLLHLNRIHVKRHLSVLIHRCIQTFIGYTLRSVHKG